MPENLKDYELVFILDPSLDDDAIQTEVDKRKALIESHGGTVEKVDMWGRRRLAYDIRRHKDGFYVLVELRGPSGLPRELERDFRVSEKVLRHLMVLRPQEVAAGPSAPTSDVPESPGEEAQP